MVEELGGQYTAAGLSHDGFSIELLILYCLGKQLTSKQASKQASRGLPNRAIKQAKGCFACLLAYQQVCTSSLSTSLHLPIVTSRRASSKFSKQAAAIQ